MPIAVGIDFGTRKSGVAVLRNEESEILMLGPDPFIPSCVAFDKTKVLVGKEALHHENGISGIKSIIGLDYEAAENMRERQELSFNLIKENGMPQIEVDYKDRKEIFSPEEISAIILSELKTIALRRLGGENISAVITVPTYFTSKRRAATKLAAELAGIDVLQVVNESTAAAIAYETLKPARFGKRRRTLVFDLGGGTLDITIIKTKGKRIMVRASDGNLELGGENFTRNLINDTENAVNSRRALNETNRRKIREEANSVKESLSMQFVERFSFEVNGKPMTVSRARLTRVNKIEYEAAIMLVSHVMARVRTTPDKIQHVVLSGGSVRIPFFREELGKLFGKQKIHCHTTESDQMVVKGAAVLASFLSGVNNTNGNNFLTAIRGLDFSDVTPFSLGFRDSTGATIVVIPKDAKFPLCRTKSWKTGKVSEILFQICEGEDHTFANNELLSRKKIPISVIEKGKVSLTVTFNLKNRRLLRVIVKQNGSGNPPAEIEIDFEKHLRDGEKLKLDQSRLEEIMIQNRKRREMEQRERMQGLYNQQPQIEPEYAQVTDIREPEHEPLELRPHESPVEDFDDDDDDDDDDVRTCEALHDFEASTEEEMTMRQGERFIILEADRGDGWTNVSRDNMSGLVPTDRLRIY